MTCRLAGSRRKGTRRRGPPRRRVRLSGSGAGFLDGWPSGLRRTPGKRVNVKAFREFESHSIRRRFVIFARGVAVQVTGRPLLRSGERVSVLRAGCRYWVFHGGDWRRPGSLTGRARVAYEGAAILHHREARMPLCAHSRQPRIPTEARPGDRGGSAGMRRPLRPDARRERGRTPLPALHRFAMHGSTPIPRWLAEHARGEMSQVAHEPGAPGDPCHRVNAKRHSALTPPPAVPSSSRPARMTLVKSSSIAVVKAATGGGSASYSEQA